VRLNRTPVYPAYMASDPTNALLTQLKNPALYTATRRVAVFRPHARKATTADGKTIEVKVTPEDLPIIAQRSNDAYQSGHLSPLIIGHRNHDPKTKETDQPPLVGYIGDFQAEVVHRPGGPVLAITQTEYVRNDKRAIVNEYPYRSAEYDADAKVIDGCAILKRRPYLDLGIVQYTGQRTIVHYALESDMNPEMMGDDDEVFYSKFAKAMARYESQKAGMTTGVDTGMGGQAPPPAIPYGKSTQAINYSAGVEAQLAAMRQQQEILRRQLAESRADALLMPLVPVVRFDYAREKSTLVNYQTEAEQVAHLQYMQETYQQLPTGQLLPMPGRAIGGAVPPPASDPHTPTAEHDRVMNYVRANPGTSYMDARAKIVTG
jgi:hypothetical protein